MGISRIPTYKELLKSDKPNFSFLADAYINRNRTPLYSVIDKVYNFYNIYWAWKRVRANGGCEGVDNISVFDYEKNLMKNLETIQNRIIDGRYNGCVLRSVPIPKRDGRKRFLQIPTVEDRIIQTCVNQVLSPVCERIFIPSNFGFRPGKSQQDAIAEFLRRRDKNKVVIKCDIKDFFPSINHEHLICKVKSIVRDSKIIRLIERWLEAPILDQNRVFPVTCGISQGGPLSPLLSNIYLNDFDHFIQGKGFNIIRFADDFVIISPNVNLISENKTEISNALSEIGLKLKKIESLTEFINYNDEMEFLGHNIKKGYYWVTDEHWNDVINDIKEKIDRYNNRWSDPQLLISRIQEMADYHKSWFFHGHFKSRIRNFNKKLRALARHYLYKYFPELYQRPITVDELKKKGLIGLSDELRFDISSDINIDDIYLTPLGENNIIQFQKSSNDNSLQRKYILVTDASFERLTYKSTLGFYIIDKQGIEGRPMKRIIKTKSSIDAEMQSMILALKYCRKRNIDEIIHISDCKAAIRALQDFYPLKNPRLNRNIKKIKEITASFKIISHYYVNRTFPLLQKADEITKDSV